MNHENLQIGNELYQWTRSRTPIDMDGTLHTDFPKFETNRDIKTIISPFVYL